MHQNISASELRAASAEQIVPGSFEPARHFYPRVLNAQVHPLVGYFMRMSSARVVNRYCHLNPRVEPAHLHAVLTYKPRHLFWAGADLFHVTTESGTRRMVVIETNSCPSGQKSMPILTDDQEQGGYRLLVERAFVPLLSRRGLPRGEVAVLYDKNRMEASGYAATIADVIEAPVWLVPMPDDRTGPSRFTDGVLEVRDAEGTWHPIRAAMRYVTQRPWNRLPVQTRTAILNPVIACLAGGRNKLIASKAYQLYNAELHPKGLGIHVPETIPDIGRAEVPLWVGRFGGHAVVKIPYSNAGQGVFTITNEAELEAFMDAEHPYDSFIVQSLIGNYKWSSESERGRFYHVGTMPNRRGEIYVADLRMMISTSPDGYRPLAVYARRAPSPLTETLGDVPSWDMLGTNLSRKRDDGGWDSDDARLMLMDRKDFNALGLGLDDLIEGFIQTTLSAIAIDRLARTLISQKGRLKRRLFRSLNDDAALWEELATTQPS
jgi:hypothetical protein